MKVKDITIINPKSNIKDFDYINYIDTSSVNDGALDMIQYLTTNIPSRAQRALKVNDILISSVRPCLKHNYLVKSNENNLVGSTGFIQLRVNDKNWFPKYVYYYLTSEKNVKYYDNVANFSQTAYPSFSKDLIEELDLPCVSFAEQQHIVNTIGTIDDLIEFNNKIIDKLHAFSDLIYQNYLINTANTAFIMLGNCCEIKTGKLNAEASSINGKYPFFTCGKDELLIDDYAFDCKAIIVAGNGEISCKYYEGKFNAYQRTYVLSPTKYFNLFQKACELGINDLIINSQGSVIKFITKGMLEAISIPLNNETITTNQKLASLYDLMFKYKKKNNKLKQIKQNLLSKYF